MELIIIRLTLLRIPYFCWIRKQERLFEILILKRITTIYALKIARL